MLERVARAIHAERCKPVPRCWHDDAAKCRLSRDLARAAFKALENPGDEVLERISDTLWSAQGLDSGETYPTARAFFRALVKIALEDAK